MTEYYSFGLDFSKYKSIPGHEVFEYQKAVRILITATFEEFRQAPVMIEYVSHCVYHLEEEEIAGTDYSITVLCVALLLRFPEMGTQCLLFSVPSHRLAIASKPSQETITRLANIIKDFRWSYRSYIEMYDRSVYPPVYP